MTKFIAIWSVALVLLAGMLFGYQSFKHSWAEEEHIDKWVAQQLRDPKGDKEIANMEVVLGFCKEIKLPRQLSKAIEKYAVARGPKFELAKAELRKELAANPFLWHLKNVCPLLQQQMDAVQKHFEARAG
jgi:hypothetical protein